MESFSINDRVYIITLNANSIKQGRSIDPKSYEILVARLFELTLNRQEGLTVRQDKGVIYNRWESCIVKFNQQLLASLGLLRVT